MRRQLDFACRAGRCLAIAKRTQDSELSAAERPIVGQDDRLAAA